MPGGGGSGKERGEVMVGGQNWQLNHQRSVRGEKSFAGIVLEGNRKKKE